MPLNLFYTMVQKSQKWPKTQIKGGSCLKSNLAPAYVTELLPSPLHNSGHKFRKESYPVRLRKNVFFPLQFSASLCCSNSFDISLEQPAVRSEKLLFQHHLKWALKSNLLYTYLQHRSQKITGKQFDWQHTWWKNKDFKKWLGPAVNVYIQLSTKVQSLL